MSEFVKFIIGGSTNYIRKSSIIRICSYFDGGIEKTKIVTIDGESFTIPVSPAEVVQEILS